MSIDTGKRGTRWMVLAVSGTAALLAATAANAYPAKIKNACRADYLRFCPKYDEDSPQLKACMRSAGGNISVRCRDALADGGYIPRKYHSSVMKK